MSSSRAGVGIVEVIVALMLLSIGLLGLVSTAIVAQRSFTRAAAVERSAHAAAALLDSVLATPAAASGRRTASGFKAEWEVSRTGGLVTVFVTIRAAGGGETLHTTWQASRAE